MGRPDKTVLRLVNEGMTTVGDLVEFDKDTMQQVVDSLRHPVGRIQDFTPNAAPEATVPIPPFVFGAKSQKRLLAVCDIV